MDAERWAISVVGQGVRGGVATGKMPSFERDQATCHVRITATARLSQRAAKDPERLHGNAAPMFYCGWSVMPLTVASECSQSQLVPREIGRKQGFLGCSFSLGEVPAAPASRCFQKGASVRAALSKSTKTVPYLDMESQLRSGCPLSARQYQPGVEERQRMVASLWAKNLFNDHYWSAVASNAMSWYVPGTRRAAMG